MFSGDFTKLCEVDLYFCLGRGLKIGEKSLADIFTRISTDIQIKIDLKYKYAAHLGNNHSCMLYSTRGHLGLEWPYTQPELYMWPYISTAGSSSL